MTSMTHTQHKLEDNTLRINWRPYDNLWMQIIYMRYTNIIFNFYNANINVITKCNEVSLTVNE